MKGHLPERLRLVLLRPRNADNLAAVARAMRNFGLFDWCVVGPNPLLLEPGARKLAVHAERLLEQVRVVDSLADAVSDCEWVVGTTMRTLEGRRRLTARAFAEAGADRPGKVALVFGDERSGLGNEDLRQCHDVSFIPTGDEQPSLNLAQAVVVYAYEWFTQHPPGNAPASLARPATDADLRALEAALREALEAACFLTGQGQRAVRTLMGGLQRARLSAKEARLWTGAMKVVSRSR